MGLIKYAFFFLLVTPLCHGIAQFMYYTSCGSFMCSAIACKFDFSVNSTCMVSILFFYYILIFILYTYNFSILSFYIYIYSYLLCAANLICIFLQCTDTLDLYTDIVCCWTLLLIIHIYCVCTHIISPTCMYIMVYFNPTLFSMLYLFVAVCLLLSFYKFFLELCVNISREI